MYIRFNDDDDNNNNEKGTISLSDTPAVMVNEEN